MTTWTDKSNQIVNNELTEMIEGNIKNLNIILIVYPPESEDTYGLNVVDNDTNTIIYNGYTSSLTSILNAIDVLRK